MKRRPLKHYDPPRLTLATGLGIGIGVVFSGCDIAPTEIEQLPGDMAETGYPGPAPSIAVDPAAIDFGQLDPVETPEQTAEVAVCNQGDAELHIDSVVLDQADPAFAVGPIHSILIAAGECSGFEVIYTPEAGVLSDDSVLIRSDDPDAPEVSVPVQGEGLPTP